jgi:hypothetical protein
VDSTTYEISRGWVNLSRWCGYLLALIAAAYVGAYLHDPKEFSLGLVAFGVLLFGGLAFVSIRMGHSPEVYAIEISADGVRQTASDAWIPWSSIVRLRERPILNRIDLIGPGGPTGIALEYQLEAFQEALDRVLEQIRIDGRQMPTSFRRPFLSWSRLFVVVTTLGLSGLGAWLWYSEGGWVGPLLMVLMIGGLVFDSLSEISRVTVADGFLSIRRGLRTIQHPLVDIESANLALRPIGHGHQYLDVFIKSRGELMPIRPSGADPFKIYNALKVEIARVAD